MGTDLAGWLFSAGAFAVSMSATPGPNNAMVAASGANFGFARTVPHMLGVAVGFPAMLVAVALGAGDLLQVYPFLHGALRWLGIAYLLWLAVKIATARPGLPASPATGTSGKPLGFVRAALFQWVNPKAWIIAVGAVTTYTTTSGRAFAIQAATLAVIFLVVTLLTVGFWTLTGVGAARLLKSERSLRAFNLVMAALLLASLVGLVREG